MSKAENFIAERTWLTPDQARKAVEIAREEMIEKGLKVSGTSPNGKLVEIVELDRKDHPYFIGSQFHPEFKSRPDKPGKLFVHLVKHAKEV